MEYPDSQEAVALALLEKILEREDIKSNEPAAARMIALYAECLAAVMGRTREPVGLLH